MNRDSVIDARDLVDQLFPQARWAILTGSILTAHRTSGSDLDIVVRLPEGDPQAPHRQSRRWRGWPVDLFVHDRQTLDYYLANETATRKPTLNRMLATGISLLGDNAELAALKSETADTLAAGPAPLSDDELARVRYGLTTLVDDLVHSIDDGESAVIAQTLWMAAGRTVVELAPHWMGTGKWLLRELREADPDFAERWLAVRTETSGVIALAEEVLERAGGALLDGYHAAGHRPEQPG